MSEYIIDWDTGLVIDTFSKNNLREEIVRCRDCKFFATNIHGNYCTKSITTLSDSNGFCAWGERRNNE